MEEKIIDRKINNQQSKINNQIKSAISNLKSHSKAPALVMTGRPGWVAVEQGAGGDAGDGLAVQFDQAGAQAVADGGGGVSAGQTRPPTRPASTSQPATAASRAATISSPWGKTGKPTVVRMAG